MWIEYNPNPAGRRVGDCAVRALSKALDTDWETAYTLVAANGYAMGDMPSSNIVTSSVLRQHGFKKANVSNKCPDCFTVKDFCNLNRRGVYVLYADGHVVTAVNGDYYDTWDSGDSIPMSIWYKGEYPIFDT